MNNVQEQLKFQWQSGSLIIRLIMVNIAVFVLTTLMIVFAKLFQFDFSVIVKDWLSLSPNLPEVLLKPWTILTYGFLHRGFFHLLFNMLWVYWIGSILVEYIGARKTLPIYLFGILLGAIFFLVAMNVFPLFANETYRLHNIGGSAGFMAILWATVTLLPQHKIRLFLIGTIPLLYVALFVTAIDLLNVATYGGASFSHLGGALAGYLFITLIRKGIDLARPFNVVLDRLATIGNSKKRTNNRRKPKAVNRQQLKVDKILDKINQYGYDSLSRKEKEFLFKQSKKN